MHCNNICLHEQMRIIEDFTLEGPIFDQRLEPRTSKIEATVLHCLTHSPPTPSLLRMCSCASHSGGHEAYYPQGRSGRDVMPSGQDRLLVDITPCSPLRVNRRFGGTIRQQLYVQNNRLKKKPEWKQPPAFSRVPCWADSIDHEDVGDMFLRNVGWLSTCQVVLYPRRKYYSYL
jgi:hypothetical protein